MVQDNLNPFRICERLLKYESRFKYGDNARYHFYSINYDYPRKQSRRIQQRVNARNQRNEIWRNYNTNVNYVPPTKTTNAPKPTKTTVVSEPILPKPTKTTVEPEPILPKPTNNHYLPYLFESTIGLRVLITKFVL